MNVLRMVKEAASRGSSQGRIVLEKTRERYGATSTGEASHLRREEDDEGRHVVGLPQRYHLCEDDGVLHGARALQHELEQLVLEKQQDWRAPAPAGALRPRRRYATRGLHPHIVRRLRRGIGLGLWHMVHGWAKRDILAPQAA